MERILFRQAEGCCRRRPNLRIRLRSGRRRSSGCPVRAVGHEGWRRARRLDRIDHRSARPFGTSRISFTRRMLRTWNSCPEVRGQPFGLEVLARRSPSGSRMEARSSAAAAVAGSRRSTASLAPAAPGRGRFGRRTISEDSCEWVNAVATQALSPNSPKLGQPRCRTTEAEGFAERRGGSEGDAWQRLGCDTATPGPAPHG
jgi:hypothetical protein